MAVKFYKIIYISSAVVKLKGDIMTIRTTKNITTRNIKLLVHWSNPWICIVVFASSVVENKP